MSGVLSSQKRTMSRQNERYNPSDNISNHSGISSYRTPLSSGTHINKTFCKFNC